MSCRLTLVLCGLLLALTGALAPAVAGAQEPATPPVWRTAELLRAQLFAAQSGLIIDGPAQAAREVADAGDRYAGALRAGVRAADPQADRDVRAALTDATAAARADDAVALASARGTARAALLRGSAAAALAATGRGDVAEARAWLLLRDFRTATRFTRPGADATRALDALQRRAASPAATRALVAKDLLDTYQARTRELLDDAQRGTERELPVRAAEAAALADGYFRLLRRRYVEDRGAAAAEQAGERFAALRTATAAAEPDASTVLAAVGASRAALTGFTAAPSTPEEAARRAQQLLRFLALVPVEYGRGVTGTEVSKDFEIQEAVAFESGSTASFADLQDQLAKRDAPRTARAAADLERLGVLVEQAVRTPDEVAPADDVEAVAGRAEATLRAAMPKAWTEPTDESDYDLIALTLDRMEAAIGAGQHQQAEQARLEAYAFFEFGPERRLQAFDQGLAQTVEGLIWFGADDVEGLATLIADRAPRREVRETRRALDSRLSESAATLGDAANKTTVVTNSAIIVFREGLEGVLILAAITASFVGLRRRLRRPVFLGALAGLLLSVLTFVLAQTLLTSLDQYGEKLEAVVGLIAIGVLLLITNWFFHKVYWSEWIGKFHRQRKKYEQAGKVGIFSGQAVGLAILGVTSVYREGFETVLFLQSLQLSAGTAAVVEGAGLGLAMTLAVAVATFALQRKLPYKKMLVVTGVMIGFVLVVMVGQTARTMQGTGWLPISTLDIDLPSWLGLWFGVFPTVETIGAQVAAMVFVIGSYVLAQELKVKRPRRRAKARREAAGTAPAPAAAQPSRPATTSEAEPSTVMAASAPPERGA